MSSPTQNCISEHNVGTPMSLCARRETHLIYAETNILGFCLEESAAVQNMMWAANPPLKPVQVNGQLGMAGFPTGNTKVNGGLVFFFWVFAKSWIWLFLNLPVSVFWAHPRVHGYCLCGVQRVPKVLWCSKRHTRKSCLAWSFLGRPCTRREVQNGWTCLFQRKTGRLRLLEHVLDFVFELHALLLCQKSCSLSDPSACGTRWTPHKQYPGMRGCATGTVTDKFKRNSIPAFAKNSKISIPP